ncbi:alpha/beta fold hydrolase BchO [Erythrobacter rubeus]|uniref:Alpha/beta fold hydrolase n=1 Tax=Erythrobacter rubeus TaxID=2760803 RepID=A0ABR8KN11_9SPHN|nr:alpha/beta fold hydrolase BchO [Erythrobacter rubeus]MBD2841124.1 alpha/beta fold hydrolase [Erythrobacter rubeus]
MSRALAWDREGTIWPNRSTSAFVPVGRTRWHLQRMGSPDKPVLLLLHGTGASVHSWGPLMPLLADTHHVIAPDLPRHAFTSGHPPEDMSLPRMASALTRLLRTIDAVPSAIIGHSAGAALALQLALDHAYAGPIVGLNSALRPFPGLAAQLFPAVAKLLFVNPLVPRLFSGAAALSGDTDRFIKRATNSSISAEGIACYEALLSNSRHTKGALAMMANWDLPTLRTRMQSVDNSVLMVHSDRDAAIPLDWAREAQGWLGEATLEVIEGLGHLAHEEAPEQVLERISPFLAAHAMASAG